MRRWRRSKVRARVVVYTTDGATFEGVLETESLDGVVLMVAALNETKLPGHVFIPRDRVSFVQIPPAEVLR